MQLKSLLLRLKQVCLATRAHGLFSSTNQSKCTLKYITIARGELMMCMLLGQVGNFAVREVVMCLSVLVNGSWNQDEVLL